MSAEGRVVRLLIGGPASGAFAEPSAHYEGDHGAILAERDELRPDLALAYEGAQT